MPNRPLLGYRKPAKAALPPVLKKAEAGVVMEDVVEKLNVDETAEDAPTKEKARLGKEEKKRKSSNSSESSSSSSEGRRHSLAKRVNETPSIRGNKRDVHSSSSSESSSDSVSLSTSSSSSDSPPSSISSLDEDQLREAFERFSKQRASSKQSKNKSTHLYNNINNKPSALKSCLKPIKPPPAKKVRFVMPVQEELIPSDDSSDGSSHSSYDSYTDPPPEPSNPTSHYSRAISARKARKSAARMARVVEFLGSEDGSCMDISEVPIKRNAPNLARAFEKDPAPAASHSKANAKSKAHAKRSKKTAEGYSSWDLESVAESNVDDGKGVPQLYQKPVYFRSNKPWTARLRSGEPIPEPIFILRTDPVTYRKEKSRPSVVLRPSQESSDDLRDQYHGRKSSSPGPSRTKSSKKTRSSGYQPPTVEGDSENDVKTGVRFREV